MKKNYRIIAYIIGLLLAFITFIPPVPKGMQYFLSLIPILVFGAEMTVLCMNEFFDKRFINRYLCAVIVTIGLIATDRLSYAAITVMFFSASSFIFDTVKRNAYRRIDSTVVTRTKKAKLIANGRVTLVNTDALIPDQRILLKRGDIIPCDSRIVEGRLSIDYTNVFGKGELGTAEKGGSCYGGGIVRMGEAVAAVKQTASTSFVASIDGASKKAHALSPFQKTVIGIAKIFEPVIFVVSLIVFIAMLIGTKDLSLSVNLASVIMVASPTLSVTAGISALTHNTVVQGRRRGVVFRNMKAVEKCAKIQTLSFNQPVSEAVLRKVEETGVIPAKGGLTELDGVLYSDRARLEYDSNPTFKMALGFTSKNADAFSPEPDPVRAAGAIRTARNYRSVLIQNLLCVSAEKLILLALALILNITPAAAILIEFAAWMICLFNATRD